MSQNYEEVFTTTLVSVKGKVLSTWADCSLKEEIYDNKLGDINNKSSAASDLTTLPELAFESDARTLVSPRILCGCPFAISISDSLQGVYIGRLLTRRQSVRHRLPDWSHRPLMSHVQDGQQIHSIT